MKINSGLKNGAVLQRNEDNLCEILVDAEFSGNPTSNFGYFEKIEDNLWRFKGVFMGGPYEITVNDDTSSSTFIDIYVGDVWLLAGQSNMEASGHPTYKDKICEADIRPYLRAFYMEEEWKPAKPILSNLSKSTDEVHLNAHNSWIHSIKERNITVRDIPPYEIQRRVASGLWFAEEMFRLTDGVPQGLIPSAVGGSPIEMWLPNSKNRNYFDAAARKITLAGNNIKGILWAQGEGNPNWEIYPEQIKAIRNKICEQICVDEIPFVQLQSFRTTIDLSYETECCWSRFREMQRNMQYILPKTETIATNDLELCDRIHLSSDSQKKCGIRMANAMYHLVSEIGYPQPTIESIRLKKGLYVPDLVTVIEIKYKNTCGDLKACGVPFGFALRKMDFEGKPTIRDIEKITIKKNTICISIEKNIDEVKEYELFYGFGNDFYCNITDGEDRAIPAMGPIKIKDYI